MQQARSRTAQWSTRTLAALAGAALLISCGGGGGGNDGSGGSQGFSAAFSPSELSIQVIEGSVAPTTEFSATIAYNGELYLGVAERNNVVADGDLQVGGNVAFVQLQLSGTLPPGVYTTDIELLACADATCSRPLPGSPARLPLRYEILPQIRLEAPAPMRRVGQAPAPSQTVTATVPSNAGTPTLSVSGDAWAFDVSLQGDQVLVGTKQLQSGTYTATITLSGSADPLYRASATVSYVVEPPPSGETPLNIEPRRLDLYMVQGTTATHRFRVQRPTWTDALDPLTLTGTGAVTGLRSLGKDEYEISVDTRNLPTEPPGNTGSPIYYNAIVARAGEHGGVSSLDVVVNVNPPLLIGNPALDLMIDTATQPSELQRASAVSVPDGATVTWSARSDVPWLRVLRASGLTGIDELRVQIDPSVLDEPAVESVAQLTVSVDRPGTLPVVRNIGVRNLLPRFDLVAPGVLTGGSATVYVHGRTRSDAGLLRSGVLSASGATLLAARIESDTRFVGDVSLLAVDIGGITPGQPVTLRATAPLRTAQIVLPSAGTPTPPTGYFTLPLGAYRFPSFAAGSTAVAFAATDSVWRWGLSGGAWSAPQFVSLPGVIDVTHAPGEADVMASVGESIVALDAVSLVPRRQGNLVSGPFVNDTLDARSPSRLGALRYARDGRAFAAVTNRDRTAILGAGVGWLAGCDQQGDAFSDIARSPCFSDPGAEYLRDISGGPVGAGIARSANGHVLAMAYPAGGTELYRTLVQRREPGEQLAPGRSVLAIDDAGAWRIRDDGLLSPAAGAAGVALSNGLPPGFVAGGYGLAGSGRFALVYAYRVASEPGGSRARDARLLMFDLRSGLPVLSPTTVPLAQIDLTDAVGCAVVPQVSGEPCVHTAHVLVTPGDRAAFVLGPRGIAASPLPAVTAAPAATGRERAQTKRPPLIKAVPVDGSANVTGTR